MKYFIKSIVEIIKKIEIRKKEIQENKRIELPFPLNVCEREFQERNGIRDYLVLEEVQRKMEEQDLKKREMEGKINE